MRSSLVRRVARLFCIGFPGKELDPETRALLELGVAGVILFSRNIDTPEHVLELTRSIKTARAVPTVVSVDQEGGPVRRLRSGFTDVPAAYALGVGGKVELARALGQLLARELHTVGIDWNFAPVLDVATNPDNPVIGKRAISDNPQTVAEYGVALALALQEGGVAACGKHFPGHGDTLIDSHLALPSLTHARDRLERVELVPFAAAARAGIASLMTAHVLYPELDAAYPATMSAALLTGVLREKLAYSGLVVSDDLEMGAILDNYGVEQAAIRGLQAGVDMFLVCHNAARATAAIEAIVHALERGELDEETLARAEQRVSAFLARWAAPARVDSDLSALRAPEHLELCVQLDTLVGADGADPTGGR